MRVTNILCLLLSWFALPAFAQFDKWEIRYKFINLRHSSKPGIYVFDDNGTISD